MTTSFHKRIHALFNRWLCLALALLAVGAGHSADRSTDHIPLRNLTEIKHIIVIYQENWSFDALYG
jgi:phospholipase C